VRRLGGLPFAPLVRALAASPDQPLEFFALDGVPLPDEDLAIVIYVNFGVPWQAVVASVDLVRFAMFIKRCQVNTPNGG